MEKLLKMLISSVLLTISASLSAQVSTWDGSWELWTHGTGTEQDPFLIENARQLAYLAYRVNNGLDAGDGHVSNHDYHYKLMVDVDLNGSESFQWTPIGYWNSDSDYQCFGGRFDGNSHTISNLYINSSANRVGLFGCADGVTIENLSVSSGTITTTGQYAYAGGIVGYTNNATITNCYNTGNVTASGTNGHWYKYAGGIVGYLEGTVTITNCYNTGDITAYNNTSNNRYAGGIVGYYATGTVTITNCCNTGDVIASGTNGGSNFNYAGGIVGYGTVTITNSYNTGDVTASGTNVYNYAGGIVGYGSLATITNCYNTGDVTASYSGGIVGGAYYSPITTNSYYLNTCGGNNTYGGQPMSADAMQTEEFVNLLNDDLNTWIRDTYNVNQGYPIFSGMKYFNVVTTNAEDITQTHATLNGAVYSTENIASCGFEYKKSSGSDYQTVTVSSSGNISITLYNLVPNTQYAFRTFCTANDCGTYYGQENTFTTQSISVTTNNASNVTQTHATLNGNLNTGDANISSQGFQYKKATDSEYQTVSVSGSGDVSTALSDLTPNTQYRFRAFCTPQGCDPIYGQEKSFNTQSIYVTTNNATDVSQSHATLNGNLNVGDANISSQGFQYKKTTDSEYQSVVVSGSGDISTTLSNLTPNTQYRFRAFCTPQGCEPIYGQERTFNTLAINVTTSDATSVTQTHATLHGVLNAGDANVSAQGFEYKKTSDDTWQTINVSGSGDISTTLSNLTFNTQYRFRTFCTAQGCEPVYGQEKTFTTQNVTVTTYAATNLTESSATLNGYIHAGDATVTDKGFKYWPANEPQNVTTISVANTGNISATVYGLTVNTTYKYRTFVFINNGTYQGDIQTFEVSWLNADTIYVYDADMLRWVSEMCNNGVTFAGKYIKLMNNIELPLNVPNNMTSIGIYPNRPFKGTFDGNGLLITNLYIDQPNTPYQGFFGYTQNANLFNVGLVNITASGRNYTGGMVAYAQNTHMRDCYVNGGTLYALSYCGGLVGYQEQGTNSIISGCYNTCTVSGNHYVGGLVGFSNYGTVRNSYVAAPVTGQGDAIGGIIGGANEVLMYNSYFSTEITGQTVAIGENNFKDGEGLTNAQMRDPQFVATMNQGLVTPVWKADYTDPLNNGFPILMWQYSSAEPCDAPENLTFTLDETSVTLNWTASPNANHYIVEYGKTNEPAHTENTPQNQFSFNIEPDVVYYWRVKSVCPYGESNFVSGDNINTDIEEINDVSKHLQLYPNPANDLVIIRLDDLNASLKYMDVYDMTGRKVMSANIDGQTHEFSVANLRSGVYYIRVQTDNELYATLKMVVR